MLGRRRAIYDDLGPPHQAVLAVIGEGQALAVNVEGTHISEQLEPIAAHVEHVAKVGFNPQRALDIDRLTAAVLDADALVQTAIDEAAASNAEALLWDAPLALVQDQHRVDHLKGRDITLVDRGREQYRLQPVQPELVGGQEARVRKVETQPSRVSCRDVAHFIGHHHDPVLFQNHPAVRHGAYYRFGFSR